MRRTGLHCLFFLSGASALIYELVWQRMLNLVFGVSTLSVSAVLAAFMGGLALGGWLFGTVADRTPRPGRLYALLEAGIGLLGLLVPVAFAGLTGVYTKLHAGLALGPWGGTCLRFAFALLVLAPPAMLIGGTVPVMGRLAFRPGSGLPATFSLLYAMNTLGAVVGAALTGFVLLRCIGMQGALYLAAGLNFLVALAAGAGANGRAVPRRTGFPARPVVGGRTGKPVLLGAALGCAALTGAAGMGFEVAWMRILGILTSNSAYGFALLLTVMLTGIGAGSLIQAIWLRFRGDPWRRLAACQWLLAAVTLAALPFFRTSPGWLDRLSDVGSARLIFRGELALTAAALFVPAVLMGMSLPLLLGGVTADQDRFGRGLGRLYAANAAGCVVGPFLAGFVLIPRLGVQTTLGVVVAGTVLVGLVAWVLASRPAASWRVAGGLAVAAAGVAGWLWLPAGVYHKTRVQEPRQLLYYREGNNATVSVVEEPDGTRSVMVDSQPVAITTPTNVVDQKMLAHLPLLLHPNPGRALTVGFGSGGTSHSMTLHGIDVDCVEIEAKVPAAAGLFPEQNHGVLGHPRFRLILDDARSWLRVAPVRYDVIVTDCTNIQYRSNGDLYTVDYFRLMGSRLAPGGVAAAWVPANGIADADLRTLLRSFQAAFPHTSVWFMNSLATDFLIVVGTPGPLDIDLERLRARMAVPAVARDLADVGLADPCRLVYTFLTADEKLKTYLGAGPLNTDDRPVLSYTTYGAALKATFPGNLVRLLACREDVSCFVRHAAPAETMMRHYAASNEVMLGHVAFLVNARPAALVHYLNGSRLLPRDEGLTDLVKMAYLAIK